MSLNHQTNVIQHLTIAGKVIRLVDAARRARLAPATIRGRLRCGWSDAQAVGLAAPPRPPRRKSNPGAGRKQRDLPALADGSEEHERQLREDGDDRFQAAMIAADYERYVHTAPCTENPIMVHRPVALRSRSLWDFV